MAGVSLPLLPDAVDEAVRQLRLAADARKCWRCGCLHGALDAIDKAMPPDRRSASLDAVLRDARARLVPVQYDCLGCEVCFPPLAMNALAIEAEACPSEQVEPRAGWPPLPGSYVVLRYNAPVAICTLTDEPLAMALRDKATSDVAMIGWVYTENLGLERIILNILGNPHIRFLIVCGPDSRQAIGHLPGQSLLSLAAHGLDARSRIIGARGKRPVIRNVGVDAVEHFRRTVEVVDLIGCTDEAMIIEAIQRCGRVNPGPAKPFAATRPTPVIQGYLPHRMAMDPAGYFVIDVDRGRHLLIVEHYCNTGVLDIVVEGRTANELMTPVIDRCLVSRLDHAAYLGKELARAQHAMATGEPYIQDAAPEDRRTTGCGCAESSCSSTTPTH